MKKLLASILILAMMVVAIPLSVSAVDADYVTFDAAYEIDRTSTKVTIDLHFSEPVHVAWTSNCIAKLCSKYAEKAEGSTWWQYWEHNTDSSIYLNPQTQGDKTYSDVLRLQFTVTNGTVPSGTAGVRLLESYSKKNPNNGVLDTETIVGISGNPVKAQYLDGNFDVAWADLNRPITLDDVQFDGWVATLTFSAPVTFANLNNAIRCCRSYAGAAPQYLPRSISYIGDVTEVDGSLYSKTVRIDFKHASAKIDGELYGYVPDATTGVRLIEYTGGDGDNGLISKSNIVGIDGRAVLGTHKDGTKNIAWKQASAIRPLSEFVKAEVTDPANFTVTLTFTKPIHIYEKSGFKLTWDYNPDANADGHYQFQANEVTYVNPTVIDGVDYSTTIKMSFTPAGGYTEIPTNAGVRIVEYNKTADLGNCSVSPTVATDTEGLPIAANRQAGTVDIAWQAMTFSGTTTVLLGAQAVTETEVLVDFSRPVALNDLDGITVNGVAAQTAVSASGQDLDNQWRIGFAQALNVADKATIVFATTAMLDAYGCGLAVPAQALLDPWQDENIDYGEDFSDELNLDSAYHFMNTDTGRSLAVGDTDEWFLEPADGVNLYALKNGEGQYVDLTGDTPTLSDYPCKVLLRKAANERYQLVIGGNKVLADSDGGNGSAAVTARLPESSQDISTGWYLTESGETRPLRVMPLGDSITYGVNRDLASSELQVSYRAQLSQELTEYFGRVVFVGSEVTAATTLSETRLLRHAGFPGYVVTDIWGESGHPGVDALIDGLCDKYTPDVVLVMLGTNDLTRMINAGTTTDADLQDQIDRYRAFLLGIESGLTDRGTIICSTLTPRAQAANLETVQAMVNTYNEYIAEMVADMAAEDKKIVFNDNFTAVAALGEAGLCSDKLHLSLAGSTALAEQYYRTVTAHYDTGSLKFDRLQAALNNQDKVVLTQDYTVTQLVIPADTTLDLNGYTVTATQVSAVTTSSMIIDATEGKGGIKIAKNDAANVTYYLQIVENNAMLPLYDSADGCYRFFTAQTTHLQKAGENSNSYKFGFQVDLADRAYELLTDAANADIVLQTQLTVTVDGEEKVNKIYTFTAETLSLYAAKKLESTRNWAITLTVTGFDAIDGDIIVITSTPKVVSSTGVLVVPTADATRTYQYTRTGV